MAQAQNVSCGCCNVIETVIAEKIGSCRACTAVRVDQDYVCAGYAAFRSRQNYAAD